ncbi:MAG: hypothetical protein HC817_02905 [Saprospiraceae bacterium]|nr:hypothetical protein [Saprospiraceae bacterium]
MWQKGEPIAELNTDDNEGAQCISTDGTFLLYTVCNREGVLGTCDIFFSKNKRIKWQPARNFAPISSDRWDSQPSLSADGRTIFLLPTEQVV